MSHVVTIQLKVKDLAALEAAAKELGGELVRGQTTYKWFGQWMNDFHADNAAYKTVDPNQFGKCDHAIRHPKCGYEIGLVKQADGSYMILADEWGSGGLVPVFGQGMQKLKQHYSTNLVANTMRKQGFMVSKSTDKAGNMVLNCTR